MSFNDYFSKQAEVYAKARPTYPDELFEYLHSLCNSDELCWDCATGNGQAAVSLLRYFKKVIATDGSAQQIKNAVANPGIEYRVATAEASGLPDNCTDIITVATAAHWFNHDEFYKEVKRVGKPGSILAIWAYSEANISKEIDEVMEWFMYDFLADYWPPGRWYIRGSYKQLPFPFPQMQTPDFFCRMKWSKEQWLNYVQSWSSYANYITKHSTDPLQILAPKLNPLWPDNDIKEVTWKLHLKCARL